MQHFINSLNDTILVHLDQVIHNCVFMLAVFIPHTIHVMDVSNNNHLRYESLFIA